VAVRRLEGREFLEDIRSRWTGTSWNRYSRAFGNQACADVVAGPLQNASPNGTAAVARDGLPAMGTIAIGPYSVLVFSQETT
jgi:hypothetical protein